MLEPAICVKEPLVPATCTAKVPVEAFVDAVIVNEDVAVSLGGGVTGDATVKLTPSGAVPTHEAANVTFELNPFRERTLIVAVLLPPCVNVTEGLDVIEKSGPAVVPFATLVS